MKTIILTLFLSIFFVNPAFADRKNVDFGWSKKGLSVDFPKYKYESRRLKSEYRKQERMPSKLTRQGFRNIDNSISRKIKQWSN